MCSHSRPILSFFVSFVVSIIMLVSGYIAQLCNAILCVLWACVIVCIIMCLKIKFNNKKIIITIDLTRFNKIATQGAPQMAVDKEANSLSRVYSYYSKFNLCLFYDCVARLS